jgi:hypothetical protein
VPSKRSPSQTDRQFFRHAPGRKVEGIDVNRDALAWNQDVLAVEPGGASDRGSLAIQQSSLLAQFRPQFRVEHQGRRGAVDVELGVRSGVAGVHLPQADQLLARIVDALGHAFEDFSPLAERERPQRGSALLAREGHRRLEVELLGRRLGDHFLGCRIEQRSGLAGPRLPSVGQVTFQCDGHGPQTTQDRFPMHHPFIS